MLQFLRSFFSFVLNTQALYLITALPCMEPHSVRMESAIGGMESMRSIAWNHGLPCMEPHPVRMESATGGMESMRSIAWNHGSAVYGTAPCAHGIRHRRHGINA